jgi:NADPH:quinone reductase-like Zn-dependent oxidoreductase
MKAAVLHHFGGVPHYEDFPDPVLKDDEILVQVKAVALENIDRAIVQGTHFASRQSLPQFPAIVGLDGIGMLDDGQLVGFGGLQPPYGAMAEKVAIPRTYALPIPTDVDAVTASAVPGSALTALFPLKWGAHMQPGETVLVNGATGFSGKLAIQVAKLLGAQRVIGTGRNEAALQSLHALGADGVIDLKQPDGQLTEAFRQQAGDAGYHVILDFLWGHPTELLLNSLVPRELSFARHRVRLVQIGDIAGPTIALAAEALRTTGLEILGAGSNLSPEAIAEGTSLMWEWLRAGKLSAEIEQVPLKEVERAWQRPDVHGKRIVIVP